VTKLRWALFLRELFLIPIMFRQWVEFYFHVTEKTKNKNVTILKKIQMSIIILSNPMEGRAIAQAVSRQSLTAEARVQSRASH
jgi:hypothetical protein